MCPDLVEIPDATTTIKGKVELATSGETAANVVVQGNDSRLISGIISPTDSTKQNDYNPTNLATSSEIRWNGTSSIGLTGLSGGAAGREILITNVTTDYLLWLESENTASSATNRFILPEGRPAFLMPNDSISLIYDSTTSRWRVKEWASRGTSMGLSFFSDFIGAGAYNANTACTELEIIQNGGGTGASAQVGSYLQNTTERPVGILQVDTGTTATGSFGIYLSGTNVLIPTLGPAIFVARVAVETAVSGTETFTVECGFADGATTITDGVIWEYRWSGSAAEWSQTRYAASSATRSNTGSPTAGTNYIWLVIFMNAGWTRADYIYSDDSISFTKSDSPTTGLPSSAQIVSVKPIRIAKSVGTTQRNADIDFCGYRYDIVRG